MDGLAIVAVAVAVFSIGVTVPGYLRGRKRRGSAARFRRGAQVRVTTDGDEKLFIVGPRMLRSSGRRLYALLEGEMNLTPANATLVAGELQRIRAGSPTPVPAHRPAAAQPETFGFKAPRERFQYHRVLAPSAASGEPRTTVGHMTSPDDRFFVALSSAGRHEVRIDVEDHEPHEDGIAVLGIEHDGSWHSYMVPLFPLPAEEAGDRTTSATIILPTATPTLYVDYDVQGMTIGDLRDLPVEQISSSVRLAVGSTERRWRLLASTPEFVRLLNADLGVEGRVHKAIRRALNEMDGQP